MKPDERIEAALRRRPSDERDYDEPLRAGARVGREGGSARRRSAVPVLLAACLAVAVVGVTGALVASRLGDHSGPAVSPVTSSRSATPSPSPSTTRSTSERLIGCWGAAPGFAAASLGGPGTAEQGDSPAAAVLRLLLADSSSLPKTGWHMVSETGDRVEFVSDGPQRQDVVVVRDGGAVRLASGGWSVSTYGSCKLMAVPTTGYGNAEWSLDPSYSLTPASTEVHVLVTEQACASASTPAPDSIRADVLYSAQRVVVTISVRSREGPQACPTNPAVAYVILLREPLGSRAMFDGGQWPEIEKTAAGRPIVTPSPSAMATVGYTVQAGETGESIAGRGAAVQSERSM